MIGNDKNPLVKSNLNDKSKDVSEDIKQEEITVQDLYEFEVKLSNFILDVWNLNMYIY